MTTFRVFDAILQENFGIEDINSLGDAKPTQLSCLIAKLQVTEGDILFFEKSSLEKMNGVLILYADDSTLEENPIGIIQYLEFSEFIKYRIKIRIPSNQFERIFQLSLHGLAPSELDIKIKNSSTPLLANDKFKHKHIEGFTFNSSIPNHEISPHFYP